MSKPLDALLDLLDLEQIELDIFRGRSPDERIQRVFGGQVAGQALVAAGRTVDPDRRCTRCTRISSVPATRRCRWCTRWSGSGTAAPSPPAGSRPIQHGKTIFTLSASFHRPEPGPSTRTGCPRCRRRRRSRSPSTGWTSSFGGSRTRFRTSPIDVRYIGPLTFEAQRDPALRRSDNLVWLRVNGGVARRPAAARLPDDLRLRPHPARLVLLGHGLSWADGRTRCAAWTTRCGSTARSGPTGGCSTPRSHRGGRRPGWPGARSSPPG